MCKLLIGRYISINTFLNILRDYKHKFESLLALQVNDWLINARRRYDVNESPFKPRLSASLIQQLIRGQPIKSNLEMLAAVCECKYNLRNASIIAKRFVSTYYGLTRLLF
jgi:hypothetical protein